MKSDEVVLLHKVIVPLECVVLLAEERGTNEVVEV